MKNDVSSDNRFSSTRRLIHYNQSHFYNGKRDEAVVLQSRRIHRYARSLDSHVCGVLNDSVYKAKDGERNGRQNDAQGAVVDAERQASTVTVQSIVNLRRSS